MYSQRLTTFRTWLSGTWRLRGQRSELASWLVIERSLAGWLVGWTKDNTQVLDIKLKQAEFGTVPHFDLNIGRNVGGIRHFRMEMEIKVGLDSHPS